MAWVWVGVVVVLGGLAALLRRGFVRSHSGKPGEIADPQALWRERQIDSVRFVTEGASYPGYRMVAEKRRIGVRAASRAEAEPELRLKAARIGANGITGLESRTRTEKVQAGVGPKGNPFFRSQAVTEWEGLAVAVVEVRRVGWLGRLLGRRDEARIAVVDGSNVLHAAGNTPDLATVRAVVDLLQENGWTAYLIFDANVGYKALGRDVQERDLASLLGVAANRVMKVPSGRQADPYVIKFARENRAVMVTNDRYRDYWEAMQGLARLEVKVERDGIWVG